MKKLIVVFTLILINVGQVFAGHTLSGNAKKKGYVVKKIKKVKPKKKEQPQKKSENLQKIHNKVKKEVENHNKKTAHKVAAKVSKVSAEKHLDKAHEYREKVSQVKSKKDHHEKEFIKNKKKNKVDKAAIHKLYKEERALRSPKDEDVKKADSVERKIREAIGIESQMVDLLEEEIKLLKKEVDYETNAAHHHASKMKEHCKKAGLSSSDEHCQVVDKHKIEKEKKEKKERQQRKKAHKQKVQAAKIVQKKESTKHKKPHSTSAFNRPHRLVQKDK